MPTLGSSKRKTVRSRVRARPSITFCRLPPDRLPTARSMFGGRSFSRSMIGPTSAPLGPALQDAGAREARQVERRHRGVLADRPRQGEALGNAVGGKIGGAPTQARARQGALVGHAVQADATAHDRLEPIDRAHQLRLAAADEPRDPGDLAGPRVEVDAGDRAVRGGQVLDIERHRAGRMGDGRKEDVDAPPVISSTSSPSVTVAASSVLMCRPSRSTVTRSRARGSRACGARRR